MEDTWFAGIDLGGTTIKLAFINMYGEIQHKWEVPTDKSGNTITVTIAKALDQKLEELNKPKRIVKWIGMGAPDPWKWRREWSMRRQIWGGKTIR